VDPRSYIERIAQELSRARGRGLVLSPADTQLALAWHAAGIRLDDVVDELRRAVRRTAPPAVRGGTRLGVSLQLIEGSFATFGGRNKPHPPQTPALSTSLLSASRADVPGRDVWKALASRAEELLSRGAEAYWSEAVEALKRTLREMPRERVREVGRALRARMAPRPAGMGRAVYRKSLQLQLLAASSERLGVPPREFLL
jgi:hypothetical protein